MSSPTKSQMQVCDTILFFCREMLSLLYTDQTSQCHSFLDCSQQQQQVFFAFTLWSPLDDVVAISRHVFFWTSTISSPSLVVSRRTSCVSCHFIITISLEFPLAMISPFFTFFFITSFGKPTRLARSVPTT